jgi:hypothetical protein
LLKKSESDTVRLFKIRYVKCYIQYTSYTHCVRKTSWHRRQDISINVKIWRCVYTTNVCAWHFVFVELLLFNSQICCILPNWFSSIGGALALMVILVSADGHKYKKEVYTSLICCMEFRNLIYFVGGVKFLNINNLPKVQLQLIDLQDLLRNNKKTQNETCNSF